MGAISAGMRRLSPPRRRLSLTRCREGQYQRRPALRPTRMPHRAGRRGNTTTGSAGADSRPWRAQHLRATAPNAEAEMRKRAPAFQPVIRLRARLEKATPPRKLPATMGGAARLRRAPPMPAAGCRRCAYARPLPTCAPMMMLRYW